MPSPLAVIQTLLSLSTAQLCGVEGSTSQSPHEPIILPSRSKIITAGARRQVSFSSSVMSPRLTMSTWSLWSTYTHASCPVIQPSGSGLGHHGSITNRGEAASDTTARAVAAAVALIFMLPPWLWKKSRKAQGTSQKGCMRFSTTFAFCLAFFRRSSLRLGQSQLRHDRFQRGEFVVQPLARFGGTLELNEPEILLGVLLNFTALRGFAHDVLPVGDLRRRDAFGRHQDRKSTRL